MRPGGRHPHFTQRKPCVAIIVLPSTRVSAAQSTSDLHSGQGVFHASLRGPTRTRTHFFKRNHFCFSRAVALSGGTKTKMHWGTVRVNSHVISRLAARTARATGDRTGVRTHLSTPPFPFLTPGRVPLRRPPSPVARRDSSRNFFERFPWQFRGSKGKRCAPTANSAQRGREYGGTNVFCKR